MSRFAILAVLVLVMFSRPALAQVPLLDSLTLLEVGEQSSQQPPSERASERLSYRVVVVGDQRPRMLMPMYASLGVLHGLDVLTTVNALKAGDYEANPLMRGLGAKGMLGVKAAAMSVNIFVVEKMWRRNRKAAVVVMVVANIGMAAVVAHNSRLPGNITLPD